MWTIKEGIPKLYHLLPSQAWKETWSFFQVCLSHAIGRKEVAKLIDSVIPRKELEELGVYQLGREEGEELGEKKTAQGLVADYVQARFGELPDWIKEEIGKITTRKQALELLLRINGAKSLEEAFRPEDEGKT